MDMVFLIIVVAITVEGLVEWAKSIHKAWAERTKDRVSAVVIQLCALAAAVFLCLVFKADLYSYLGIVVPARFWWVTCGLTGIFASRGSNYISDLIGRLRKGSGWMELIDGLEIVDGEGVKIHKPPGGDA